MSTAPSCCLPAPLPLHRPWWARILVDLQDGWRRLRRTPRTADIDLASLAHLDAATLRDIGAPPWVHERDRGAGLRALERMRW